MARKCNDLDLGKYLNMHRFTKIVFVTVALVSAMLLSSCNNDKTNNITIVVNNSAEPFSYIDSDGELTGFEVELMKAIAHNQGFKVKLISSEWEWITSQLKRKVPKFDGAMSLITMTTERWEYMEFTHPYFRSGIAVAGKNGITGIISYDDLKGKKVAVKTNTTVHEYAVVLAENIGFTLVERLNADDAYKAVTSGEADVIMDEHPMIWYRVHKKGLPLDIVIRSKDQFTFNLAVGKSENYSLIRMFNDGLLNLEKDGTYQSIMNKYFPDYKYY